MGTLTRLAKKVQRIANEIEASIDDKLNYSKSLKETTKDVLEIEKEIDEIISSKIAQVYLDSKLRDLYSRAAELIGSSESTISNLEKTNSTKDFENARIITNSLMSSIKKLDSFYKTHLNPKFNYHGITHQMINKRMNDLKENYNTLRKELTKKWK